MDSWCFPHFDPELVKQTDGCIGHLRGSSPSSSIIKVAAACPRAYETPVKDEGHHINNAATWERHIDGRSASTRRYDARIPYCGRE
ncbi:uncharacterized protein FFB20_15148 [Fusarium fujikuroi]|nr:uncharacterized protein FFB20_15148 [Fusarium fujikuroi]SCO19082.1 uncharacterized protein FFC1_13444 [Fusarium fujikuroi]VZI17288.1 unnamed protein product [Fusarium fujikuroi]